MKKEISRINKIQEEFFNTHKTKAVGFRLDNLKKMKQLILSHQNRLYDALWADLHKPAFEAYAGQSCVAPDYLLIHQEIKDAFLEKLIHFIRDFYGENPQLSPDYPRVVNRANIERLQNLISAGRIVTGGTINPDEKYIAPTVIDDLHPDDPIMESEVFGPVLPVLTYTRIEEAIEIIKRHPNPLAFYLFTNNRALQKRLLNEVSFGTATLNDAVIHFINSHLPFGGVGESGMGKYHGKKSFETFTNYKSILKKTNRFDFPVRYPPYTNRNENLLKQLLR